MSTECSHNCSSCSSNCGERTEPQSLIAEPHKMSRIKKVIGVVSGKGGVGKSLVTSLMACSMQKNGFHSAVLDADITGPSIPKVFGVTGPAMGTPMGILPVKSETGIDIMSINLLVQDPTDPVIWRGSLIASAVKQFWTDIIWSDVDFMFVDMPPGTGDVPLTVFQSLPVDGIIIVTSPQELVSMIVEKAVKMAEKMEIPVLGLVENMSYLECPDCGKKISVFGESHVEEVAAAHNLPVLGRIPIDSSVAAACDAGKIETVGQNWLDKAVTALKELNEA
ncbi:MAG: Mrp/NBP35 family ATP-binding protein [Lachnospiraceae bacterium]|nr:Mrp/NBP35 family ATP-binding protein [Lachnospiraceae bacterium]